MTNLTEYLRSKGLTVKRAGPDDVHVACWYCKEDPGKRGRLYVNVSADENVAGLHFCHLCGTRGNLRTMRKHFGDPVDDDKDDTSHAVQGILQVACKYYEDALTPDVLSWLKKERGLRLETIQQFRLGWAPGGLLEHLRERGFKTSDVAATGLAVERNGNWQDFLLDEVVIPYQVAGSVVMLRGKKMDGKYRTPPHQKARIFNSDAVWNAHEILICEGEFDAMVLSQLGYDACGVPGATTWQEAWNGYFEKSRLIYICFDPDQAGNNGAEKIKEQLGSRTRRVEFPVPENTDAGEVDPSYLVVKWQYAKLEFDQLLNEAVLRGSLLITVDDAYREWKELQGQKGLQLGYPDLDMSISPGLLKSQVLVVLAKTNTGKTLFLLNLFQRISMLQKDAKILFISLEQTRGDWFERAQRIWNFYNLDCEPQFVEKETLKYWRERLLLVDKNRVSEEELLNSMDEYELQMGCKPDLVAVDYLGYWAAGFKGKDRYERVSGAVESLKAVAKEKRVPIVSPHQVSRVAEFGSEPDVDAARDSGAVEETADFVFGLWSPDATKGKQADQRNGLVNLRIGKSRHGGKGDTIKIQFAPVTLAMVPYDDNKLRTLASDELQYNIQRDTWKQAIFRHRTGRKDIHLGPVPELETPTEPEVENES
jgi:archaellum biogenesis ATPase FlaH